MFIPKCNGLKDTGRVEWGSVGRNDCYMVGVVGIFWKDGAFGGGMSSERGRRVEDVLNEDSERGAGQDPLQVNPHSFSEPKACLLPK